MQSGRHHLRDAMFVLSLFAGLATSFGTTLLFNWRWTMVSFLLGALVVLLFLPLVQGLHHRAEKARLARYPPRRRPAARSLPVAVLVVTLVVALSFLALAVGTYAYFEWKCAADANDLCYQTMLALAPAYVAVGSVTFGILDAVVLVLLRFLRPTTIEQVPVPRAQVRLISSTRPMRGDPTTSPATVAAGPRTPAPSGPDA